MGYWKIVLIAKDETWLTMMLLGVWIVVLWPSSLAYLSYVSFIIGR
jgi:hypothetical protein